jgi:hypothetical protein
MFTLGQKVRCVDATDNQQQSLVNGQEYTVDRVFPDGRVQLVEQGRCIYMPQRFVAADSGPPDLDFKVNDWVFCVDAEDCDGLLCDGAVYRVVEIRGEYLTLGHTDNIFYKGRFTSWLTAAKIAADDITEADIAFAHGGRGVCAQVEDETARRKAQPVCTGDNPKKSFGATKPDLGLCPPVGTLHQAMAHEDGNRKYGAFNWRHSPVEAMTYIHAAKRHLDLFLDRQDVSSDSNVHNLGAVMACCAILLDSQELGILIDNRPPAGPSEHVQTRLREQKVAEAEARKTK